MNENEIKGVDILQFFKPKIVDVKQLNIKKYDTLDLEGDNKLIGYMNKTFVRVDIAAIKDLIDELQNKPNSSYLTCANDVIKQGITPEKISVMLKFGEGNYQRWLMNNGGNSLDYRESVASQLLNWLECPTCYNFVVKHGRGEYLASVDFISADEKFYSLEDFEMNWSYNLNKMENDLNNIIKTFDFKSEDDYLKNKQQIFNDFMYTILAREVLLSDGDYHTGNIGLLYNEKTKSLRFINFDLEFLFLSPNPLYKVKPAMIEIRKRYPEVYKKFIHKTKQIYAGFDKMRVRNINIWDEFSMYHILMGRVKSVLSFDKHMITQDKIKNFFRSKKDMELYNVK